MGLIVFLAVGNLIGWVAGLVMRTDGERSILLATGSPARRWPESA